MEATLAWYDLDEQQYHEIAVPTQAEVLSLVGDIARGSEGQPAVRAHAVLGLSDGTTRGGHLLQATVRPVLEVSLTESPGPLSKTFRPEFGQALIDLDDKPFT